MARVTLQTIADAVGVSRTTVSNAFSRPDQLTEELRTRILDYAAEVGYCGPDPVARTLRRGRAGSIGLLFTESLPYAFADPYAVGFLRGIAEATEVEGISLLLVPSPPGQASHEAVADALVDAFCVYSMPDGHEAVEVVRRRRLPTVFVDEPDDGAAAFVGIDDRSAAAGAARHLLDLGHRRVGVVSMRLADDHHDGPVDADRLAAATHRVTRERLGGYLGPLGGVEHVTVVEASRNERGLGARLAGGLLDTDPLPTAVLAMSDQLALGVLDAARDRGLDVPGDLSVVGFDDVPEAAEVGLTTVRQPIVDKGREAGALLLGVGRPGARRVLLPTDLVVRGSTAAAARRGRRRR